MPKLLRIKIKRQESPESSHYWQDFELPYHSGMSLIAVLQEIQKRPVTQNGYAVAPVCFEQSFEETSGTNYVLVNGKIHSLALTTIDDVEQPIRIEPLSHFPVIRDLVVDRSVLQENLKKTQAWVDLDNLQDKVRVSLWPKNEWKQSFDLSLCTSCGACLEVCPQYNPASRFLGVTTLLRAKELNQHPTGQHSKNDRLDALMQKGGVDECRNSQNCVKACPQESLLQSTIPALKRNVTVRGLKRLFG